MTTYFVLVTIIHFGDTVMTQEILPYTQKAYVLEDMEKHTNEEYNVSV